MDRKTVLLLLLAINLAVVDPRTIQSRKKEHPGCLVWWFLPDCPLGRIFGGDPFGIYPWKKFCKEYTAFENTEFCPTEAKSEALTQRQPRALY